MRTNWLDMSAIGSLQIGQRFPFAESLMPYSLARTCLPDLAAFGVVSGSADGLAFVADRAMSEARANMDAAEI
jgi:hypothetical protein